MQYRECWNILAIEGGYCEAIQRYIHICRYNITTQIVHSAAVVVTDVGSTKRRSQCIHSPLANNHN